MTAHRGCGGAVRRTVGIPDAERLVCAGDGGQEVLFHRAPADLLHLGLVAAQSAVLRCLVPPQRVSGDGERPEPHRTVPLSDTFQILITASSEPVASQWPLALHAAASTCGDARPREAGAAAAGMAAAPPHLPRVPPSLLAPSMPQPIADFDDLSRSSGRRGIHWRERVPACRHAGGRGAHAAPRGARGERYSVRQGQL